MARFAVVEQPDASTRIPDEFYILREIAGRLQSHVKNTTQAINLTSRGSRIAISLSSQFSRTRVSAGLSRGHDQPLSLGTVVLNLLNQSLVK